MEKTGFPPSMFKITHNQEMSSVEVADLYNKAKLAGIADAVFYEGGTKDSYDWLDYCRSETTWILRVDHMERGLCGFFWLNNFRGVGAQLHICLWGVSATEMMDLGNLAGAHCYNWGLWGVYGIFPAPYRHLSKMASLFGFKYVGEVPHACYMARRKTYVTGRFVTLDLKEKYDGRRKE